MEHVRRLVFEHRRVLAALCAGLAVLTALGSVRAADPPTTTVAAAARDLPGGTVVEPDDVRTVRVPDELVPDGARSSARGLAGDRLAAPVRRGEVLTDARLVGPGLLTGQPAGTVVATVRVADPAELAALDAGQRVDVVAVAAEPGGPGGSEARIVARGLLVVAVDASTDEPGGAATIRVTTDRDTAVDLAAAAAEARLGVLPSADA